MSVVRQGHGPQILPPIDDPQATVTMWTAQQCLDADHRRRQPLIAVMASRLYCYPTEGDPT